MTKESFELLLTDLYDIYEPSKKVDIPLLLDKYNGQEFDAVYHMLFKYNYPRSEHYNSKIGTQANIKTLIADYSKGERTLSKSKPVQASPQEVIQQKIQEANDSIKTTAADTANQVQKYVDEQLKAIDEHINARLQELNKNNFSEANENLEVKLNLLYTEKELVIPYSVKNMCIGTRFLVFDVEQRFVGLEIKDIVEDYISSPGRCIKEITIDKV